MSVSKRSFQLLAWLSALAFFCSPQLRAITTASAVQVGLGKPDKARARPSRIPFIKSG